MVLFKETPFGVRLLFLTVFLCISVIIYYVIYFAFAMAIHFLDVLILFSAGSRQRIGISQSFKTDVAYEMLALHRKVILHHDQTWRLVTVHHGLSSKGH